MTTTRPLQNAFSSGEVGRLLYARSDFQRWQTGLARCRGFLPIREGGFTRAPGTVFRGQTRGDALANLLGFEFARKDACILEFTDLRMRVWRYGALVEASPSVPYELVTPFAEADLPGLGWAQSNDVVYIADGAQPIQILSRLALDNWTIGDFTLDRGPFRTTNSDEAITIQASAATGAGITLTGTGGPFDPGHVGGLFLLEPTDWTAVPVWTGNVAAAVNDQVRYGGNVYRLSGGTNTGVNAPVHTAGKVKTDKANPNTEWEHVSTERGIVRITGFTSANSVTANVLEPLPDGVVTDATWKWADGAWSDLHGYPAVLALYEDRLWAASTASSPRTVWVSTYGGFNDFLHADAADASFAFTLKAIDRQNRIEWMRPGKKGLYVGAGDEMIRVFSSDQGQIIGPTTFDTEDMAGDGAASVPAIRGHGYPLYVSADGGRLMEPRYALAEDGTAAVDLSLPSPHIGNAGFEELAWLSVPQKTAWIRRGDGTLAFLLYDPTQDVLGWAVVPMADGTLESMAVTASADGRKDVLTLSILRTVNGSTVRYVEEQALIYGVLQGAEPIHEALHLFAASIFDVAGAPTDTFTVAHLAGEEVYAWTDRGEFGPFTADAATGAVTLPEDVEHARIGLFDATHEAETLDIFAQARDGSSQGRAKRLKNGGGIDLHQTANGTIAAIERHFGGSDIAGYDYPLVARDVAYDIQEVYSGTARVDASSGLADAVRYRIKPKGAAPLTVLSLTPNVEEAGA